MPQAERSLQLTRVEASLPIATVIGCIPKKGSIQLTRKQRGIHLLHWFSVGDLQEEPTQRRVAPQELESSKSKSPNRPIH